MMNLPIGFPHVGGGGGGQVKRSMNVSQIDGTLEDLGILRTIFFENF